MSRSEPEILADLIRLCTRLEVQADAHRIDGHDKAAIEAASDAELVEEARAALHKHTLAAGKAKLAAPDRAPIDWWAIYCISVGTIQGALLGANYAPWWALAIAGACAIASASLIANRAPRT